FVLQCLCQRNEFVRVLEDVGHVDQPDLRRQIHFGAGCGILTFGLCKNGCIRHRHAEKGARCGNGKPEVSGGCRPLHSNTNWSTECEFKYRYVKHILMSPRVRDRSSARILHNTLFRSIEIKELESFSPRSTPAPAETPASPAEKLELTSFEGLSYNRSPFRNS